MKESDVLYELLTRGIVYHIDANVALINRKLRRLKYEAVSWFDKSCIVLRDLDESNKICFPWRKQLLSDFLKIIEAIAKNELDVSAVNGEALEILEEEMWVEKSGPSYVLGKRFLVQNSEYLLSISGRYKRCRLCSFLVEGYTSHKYCEDVYEKELHSQKKSFEA